MKTFFEKLLGNITKSLAKKLRCVKKSSVKMQLKVVMKVIKFQISPSLASNWAPTSSQTGRKIRIYLFKSIASRGSRQFLLASRQCDNGVRLMWHVKIQNIFALQSPMEFWRNILRSCDRLSLFGLKTVSDLRDNFRVCPALQLSYICIETTVW